MPTSITREFSFCAGHRVLGHGGKCRHIHGHNYLAEVTVTTAELNDLGMVIDFSVLKDVVGGWIDANWDHNFLCNPNDPVVLTYQNNALLSHKEGKTRAGDVLGDKRPYVMTKGANANPTAENMAEEFAFMVGPELLNHGIKLVQVTIHETPNCKATYTPEA